MYFNTPKTTMISKKLFSSLVPLHSNYECRLFQQQNIVCCSKLLNTHSTRPMPIIFFGAILSVYRSEYGALSWIINDPREILRHTSRPHIFNHILYMM